MMDDTTLEPQPETEVSPAADVLTAPAPPAEPVAPAAPLDQEEAPAPFAEADELDPAPQDTWDQEPAETPPPAPQKVAPELSPAPEQPVPPAPEPAAPAAGEGVEDMTSYWGRVLTGNPATVPAEVRSLAGADDDSLEPEEQDYRLCGAVNRSWVVDHFGVDKESVQNYWPDCRSGLADALQVADNEQEVFMGLSAHEQDTPRREAAKLIFQKAYLAGLHGEADFDIGYACEGLDAADRDAAEALGVDALDQGAQARRRWMPLAERVARGVDAFSGVEEEFFSAPRVLAAMPDLAQAVDELADLDEEEQGTVLYLAAGLAKKQRPAGEEGLTSRLVRAARRGAGNIGMGVLQSMGHAGVTTLSNLGRMLDGESGEKVGRAADAMERRMLMVDRLRGLAQQELAPLYPADSLHRAESYLIDAAEATPAAMLAFCGGSGFAALAASGMGESVTAARRLNPQGDRELQLAAGILGGAVQGAIYMGMGRLGGRMLEQSIANFMKSRGAGAGAFTMNALKSAGAASLHGAELVAAGKLAEASELGAQELAARLSGTASNIDWKSFGDNLTDIETNMRAAAAILPFLLIGSGRVALRHFRSPRAVLGEGGLLRALGVDEEACGKIMEETDIDRQSSLLCQALRNSRCWSAPGFLPDIVRAMCLFNGDYFKGFKDLDCIRDFLHLPAERSLIETPVMQPRDATAPEIMNQEGHVNSRELVLPPEYFNRSKLAACLTHWDEIYQKSHVWEHTPRQYFGLLEEGVDSVAEDRVGFYRDVAEGAIPTVPIRMRNIGYFNPQGEAERRALVRDRAQECIDLSYQFLLSTFSVDAMLINQESSRRASTHMEITRNNVVGQTARAVLDMAMGMTPAKSRRKLSEYLGLHCVRRSYRGVPPFWLRKVGYKQFLSLNTNVKQFSSALRADPADYRNVMRVAVGLNACSRTLTRLLPMTADFHTAIARGMSPLQAYHHLLVRELGFDPAKVAGYPMKEIEDSTNSSDFESFSRQNKTMFESFRALCGSGLEKSEGEDGKTYWRIKRPEGGYTRWHANEQDAINDLCINLGPYFGPMGSGVYRWLRKSAKQGDLNLDEMPRVSYREYSGFDHLCGLAIRDLGKYWYQSVTRTQPGFHRSSIPAVLTGKRGENILMSRVMSPMDDDAAGSGGVDRLSLLNPASMIHGRFRVFWERAFHGGTISVPEVGRFLMQRGHMSPDRYADIIEYSRQLPYPKNPNTPLRLTPPPDIDGMYREMANEMARFHNLYFLATLDEQKLPETVRTWFRVAPFCPDMPPEDCDPGVRIEPGYREKYALGWTNRRAAMQLREVAPEVDAMRKELAYQPVPEKLFGPLFRAAVADAEEQRYEQGWCYRGSGPSVFTAVPQSYWNLLLQPERAWRTLSDEEKDDIRDRVREFCAAEPAQDYLDAAGRGENADPVECAFLQLDRVLNRFPALHRYSVDPGNPASVRMMTLGDDLPSFDTAAGPELKREYPRWLGEYEDHSTLESFKNLPRELREDTEAMASLRFLDVLRRAVSNRPYSMAGSIWWNRKPYGGKDGARPAGLEKWNVEEPLANLFQLLRNVEEQCRAEGTEEIEVCDVKLRGASWNKEDFAELEPISIYRAPKDRSRVYRLMPGYPDSPNIAARTPYVVACHRGVYMNGNHAIRRAEDMGKSFNSLESFTPKFVRYYSAENTKNWRNISLETIFDSIVNRPAYMQSLRDPVRGLHGMGEMLMRLCEDTGFCLNLYSLDPYSLSREQAHVVNIASSMLECVHTNASVKSMRRLRDAVSPVHEWNFLRENILNMLHKCCDATTDSTVTHGTLLRQLELKWDDLEGIEPPPPVKKRGRPVGSGIKPKDDEPAFEVLYTPHTFRRKR